MYEEKFLSCNFKISPLFLHGLTVMYLRADLLVFILLQVNTESIDQDFSIKFGKVSAIISTNIVSFSPFLLSF